MKHQTQDVKTMLVLVSCHVSRSHRGARWRGRLEPIDL